MSVSPRLEAYHFHEREWDSYDDLSDAFEWEVPDQFNVVEYVCDRWAEHEKNRVALYYELEDGRDVAYTFRQLRNEANRLANYFEREGVEKGDRIAVNGSQKPETLIATFAAWKVGAVSVPLSVLLGPDGLEYRLNDAEVRAFVVDGVAIDAVREIKDDVPSLDTILTVDVEEQDPDEVDFWNALEGQDRRFETVQTDAEDDAQIIYTSGTTGAPKGTLHAHRHFLGLIPPTIISHRNMDVRDDDVIRATAEWAWAGSMNDVVLTNLFLGNPVVGRQSSEFEPEAEFDLVERFGITVISTASTAYRMMREVPDPKERWDLSSVRVLIAGGEAVGKSLMDWMEETFDDPALHPGYGQTESPFVLTHCEALDVSIQSGDTNYCGVPAPGYEARVVDPETKEETVERGEVGELAIRYDGNPSCFKEYLNKPEKTAQKITDGWMLTEDLVRQDEDGYYEFKSRDDDVILTSGYRVGPEEIEESLEIHEAVVHAGVIGVPHDARGEVPKAFVQLSTGYEPSADLREDLQNHVKDRLAKYEYPRELEFVDELPTTTTGKIRRVDLREREGIE